MSFIKKQVIQYWLVEVPIYKEGKKYHIDRCEKYYFLNEGLAKLAVEWAYSVHREKIASLPDVEITEEKLWPLSETTAYCRKLVWHQKRNDNDYYYSIKDYFSYNCVEEEFEIIGE